MHASVPLKTWTFDNTGATADAYRLLTQAFFRACLGEAPSPVEPEGGMWVNECIDAAYAASETGQIQQVTVPEA